MKYEIGDTVLFTYDKDCTSNTPTMLATVVHVHKNGQITVNYHTTANGHSLDQDCTPLMSCIRKLTKLDKVLR